MTPQLVQTLATFTAMTAFALVVGGIFYLLCLFLKKLGVLVTLDILIIFAWFVIILLSSEISGEMIPILLKLCGTASLCALLKTPDNKRWKSSFRFLLTSGSSSLISGAMLLSLVWSFTSHGFQMVLLGIRDTQFLLLAIAPCAISAMHSVLVNSQLRPGVDRHLREGE